MPENSSTLITTLIDIFSLIVNFGLAVIGSVGIFLAWRQLKYLGEQVREARLSSSMAGALELYNQFKELSSLREAIKVSLSGDWNKRSNQEQVEHINTQKIIVDGKERPLKFACIDIANFYETIGALVFTKVFPYDIAYHFFGGSTIDWWERLSVWAKDFRERTNDSLAFTNFENMAKRFYGEKTNKIQTRV